uniref:Secreted protein n=1 Tax=Rhizophora mucronata TaxID=61149 RepID=A0A2P2IIT6_RHIMU
MLFLALKWCGTFSLVGIRGASTGKYSADHTSVQYSQYLQSTEAAATTTMDNRGHNRSNP